MRTRAALALFLPLAACGVPAEQYAAKDLEAREYLEKYRDESAKNADLAARIADLAGRIGTLEEESRALGDRVRANERSLAAKQAELQGAQQRIEEQAALIGLLSRSQAQLERARAELERKSDEYERLSGSLQAEIAAGQVEISELRGRMTVRLKDQILFASGSAAVGREGRAALDRVADALQGVQGRSVRVEGYTDDVPTGPGGPYPSNWELSAARALAVVRYLQEQGVDPTLLVAAGYGQFHPVASNDTPEGRSQNRRIEIVLAADVPPLAAPAAGAPAPAKAPRRPRR